MAAGKLALSGVAVLVVGGLIAFAVVPSCQSSGRSLAIVPPVAIDGAPQGETIEAVIDGQTFHLETALTQAQRVQGLSDRKAIADDGGMVFAFPREGYRSFVMRRCYVPIDILYLDARGRVVSTHQMQVIEPIGGLRWQNPSSGYDSGGPAQFAVEIKGGLLDALDVKPGDIVKLPLDELKRQAQ